jgi:hypothetical protein
MRKDGALEPLYVPRDTKILDYSRTLLFNDVVKYLRAAGYAGGCLRLKEYGPNKEPHCTNRSPALRWCVPGVLRTLAISVVRAGSARNPCLTHNALRLSVPIGCREIEGCCARRGLAGAAAPHASRQSTPGTASRSWSRRRKGALSQVLLCSFTDCLHAFRQDLDEAGLSRKARSASLRSMSPWSR